MDADRPQIAGVVLAGGLSRRMGGGDKALRLLAGKPMLGHVLDRAARQVGALVLNANGDSSRFAEFGLPCVADSVPGFAGPLAGVLAGLDWAATHVPETELVASFPADAPFLPRDMVRRLYDARDGAAIAIASSGGRTHPVCGLWPVALRDDLRRALIDENIHKVETWIARHKSVVVDFAIDPIDPFFNANAPDDLARAEALLR
ncbi:MAG: molybdenum cofactor guanylyltransferase MobA [Alphaproteobacteria bacterium]|nr:molybdenum cofactor guanylyltransferase MobA [Alphaproteobacteria bacterium]